MAKERRGCANQFNWIKSHKNQTAHKLASRIPSLPLLLPYLLPKSRKRNWCARRDNYAACHSDSAPTSSRWHCAPSDWPNRSACSCRSRSPRDWTDNSMAAMVVHMHNERHELELNLDPLPLISCACRKDTNGCKKSKCTLLLTKYLPGT